jgi:hypothetical protein
VVLPIADARATAMSSRTMMQGFLAWRDRTSLGCNMRRTCVVHLTWRSHAAHVSHLLARSEGLEAAAGAGTGARRAFGSLKRLAWAQRRKAQTTFKTGAVVQTTAR